MTKKITVPEEYQFRLCRIDGADEKRLLDWLNFITANAYRDGYATGYHDRGIFTRIKRRITRK